MSYQPLHRMEMAMTCLMSHAKAREAGFTLIELLIVVAIIAILAAIAIPQFSLYRERAVRTSIVLDAKNAMTQEDAYYVDKQTYVAVPATTGPATITIGASIFAISKDNTLTVTAGGTGIPTSYIVTIANPNSGTAYGDFTRDNLGACAWSGGAPC